MLDFGATGGTITDAGVRSNVSVALRHLSAWIAGSGAVAIDNLMEDVATVEIARSQLWQWIANASVTAEGTTITRNQVLAVSREVLADLRAAAGHPTDHQLDRAAAVFAEVALSAHFPTFITVGAYGRYLVDRA